MTPRRRWRLAVREQFAAAHALRNYHGRCEALHGHNFGVEVVVEGETLDPDTEMLLDFAVLRRLLREALDPLDHAHLNAILSFDERNPTSENIARHVWRTMADLFAREGVAAVRLVAVTVAEKEGQSATYMEG